jgi:hypothetical protein
MTTTSATMPSQSGVRNAPFVVGRSISRGIALLLLIEATVAVLPLHLIVAMTFDGAVPWIATSVACMSALGGLWSAGSRALRAHDEDASMTARLTTFIALWAIYNALLIALGFFVFRPA